MMKTAFVHISRNITGHSHMEFFILRSFILCHYLIKVLVHRIEKNKHLAQMYHLLAGVLYKSSRFIFLLYIFGIRTVTTGYRGVLQRMLNQGFYISTAVDLEAND